MDELFKPRTICHLIEHSLLMHENIYNYLDLNDEIYSFDMMYPNDYLFYVFKKRKLSSSYFQSTNNYQMNGIINSSKYDISSNIMSCFKAKNTIFLWLMLCILVKRKGTKSRSARHSISCNLHNRTFYLYSLCNNESYRISINRITSFFISKRFCHMIFYDKVHLQKFLFLMKIF